MNFIPHPLTLESIHVKLVPLQAEHFPALIEIGKCAEIWEQLPVDGTDAATLTSNLQGALLKRTNGEQYPFTAIDKTSNKIFGSTRYFEIVPEHKKLEIGWTWYHPDYWGSGLNNEIKLLLLTYGFETLKLNRIQLKTRNTNLRSRAAIAKIGAKEEGILRNDRIMPGGEIRDTVMFSIIKEEWEVVKGRLEGMIKNWGASKQDREHS